MRSLRLLVVICVLLGGLTLGEKADAGVPFYKLEGKITTGALIGTTYRFENSLDASPQVDQTHPLTGVVVFVGDACASLNPATGPNQIALIERGTCTFTDKATNAAKALFAAAIIFNNQAPASGTCENVLGPFAVTASIPVIWIERVDAFKLLGDTDATFANACSRSMPTAPAVGSSTMLGPTPVPRRHLVCGTHVWGYVALDRNLANCDGAGLIVDRSGTTIDLRGHEIAGLPGYGTSGIRDDQGFDRVQVFGGRISEFLAGINFQEVDGFRRIAGEIRGIVFSANNEAIGIIGGSRVGAVSNRIVGGGAGFYVSGTDSLIASNRIGFGTADGIVFTGATRVVIRRNVIRHMGGWGIYAIAAPTPSGTIVRNRVFSNGGGINVPDDPGIRGHGNVSSDNAMTNCSPTRLC